MVINNDQLTSLLNQSDVTVKSKRCLNVIPMVSKKENTLLVCGVK